MRPPPDQVKKKSKQKATGSRGDSGSGLDKPKHIPLTPPRGDVATSGGNYGTQQAEKFKKTPQYRGAVRGAYEAQPGPVRQQLFKHQYRGNVARTDADVAVAADHLTRIHRNREIAHDQAQHDVITEADHKTLLDWEQRVEAGDKSTHPGLPEATIRLSNGLKVPKVLFATDPSVLKRAGFNKDKVEQALQIPGKVTANAFREGVDIPKNLIPGTYETFKPTVEGVATGDPNKALEGAKKTGNMLAQPYEQLYHHPGKFVVEHPLSTALMLWPAGKLAARGIGTAESRAALGSTGVEDIKFGKGLRGKGPVKTRQMTDQEMNRRVDINVHEARERQVPPHYNVIDEFAHKGTSGKNKAYPTFEKANEAEAAVSKQNGQKFSPYKAGPGENDPYYLVPDKALQRLDKHIGIGEKTPKAYTGFNSLFRKGVLMSSPKWIPGNVTEATLRSLTSRSGLMDLKSGHAAQSALSRHNEVGGQIWGARTTYGGHLHMAGEDIGRMGNLILTSETAKTARGPIGRAGNSLAEVAKGVADFSKATVTSPAHILHPKDVINRQAAGIARSYNGWSKFVFSDVNGHIEHQFQTAIQGQILRKNKLIPRALGVRNKQLADEWAKGTSANPAKLRNLATAVGKEIDRAYGRYGKMSPNERWVISNFTPFLRWSHNAVDFLYHVMPADHPVLTALAASMSVATEDWRKQAGQYYSNDQLLKSKEAGTPSYLQGSIPGKNGSVLRLSHYGPMGIFEQGLGGIQDLAIPQFSTLLDNLAGKDWKGDKLAHDGDAVNVLAALTSMVEQSIPYVSLGASLAGIRRPNMAKGQKIPGSVRERGSKLAPFTYTKVGKPASKAGGGGPSFGGGSDSGGFSFGGGSSGGFDFSQ